jgi:hypothetical protein
MPEHWTDVEKDEDEKEDEEETKEDAAEKTMVSRGRKEGRSSIKYEG